MEAPDAELIRIIARGGGQTSAEAGESRLAEAELCRRFAPRIYLYGRRHLRDDDRARELVQAVLLVVLQAARAGRVAEPEHADRFMLGTCRHLAARLRTIEAREARSAGSDALEVVAESLQSANPWESMRADVGALVLCLGTLDERSRQVVTLTFSDECPTEEIAKRLAMTTGNVRVTRHRAVAALRRCLDVREATRQESRA